MEQMGLLQIDSVNVLVRSHELPLFARLGPHPRTLVPDALAAGSMFEYVVHEACFAPISLHPLLRWRMDEPHRWAGSRRVIEELGPYLEEVYRRVASSPAGLVAGDLGKRVGPRGTWWDYDEGKIALEGLFDQGRVAVRRRASDFARIYDLPARLIPASVLAQPAVPVASAIEEIVLLAARSCGVGTLGDLADYYRLRTSRCRTALAALVADGRLVPVSVAGWKEPGYALPETTVPRRVAARALLSPFDPVVWNRDRALRLFGFHYRIEIYTPAAQRKYGYYVLPFLLGDRLVGRVDLKADRAGSALLVQSAWIEPAAAAESAGVASELAAELRLMAGWLGLASVVVIGKGDLGPTLGKVVAEAAG